MLQKLAFLLLPAVFSLVSGAILSLEPLISGQETYPLVVKRDELVSRALGSGNTLRILCLGASIVYGYHSSDGNGFRYSLRKKLIEDGNIVNMIGSLAGGTMADNQVEGWIGYRIAEVGLKADISLPQLPNVVCIHVGTNDMNQGYNVPQAAERLAKVIDKIFNTVPGVTIIVSTLLPSGASAAGANVLRYNADLITVVSSRAAAGKRITLVDMHTITDLGADGIHPTDEGYRKMSTVFYNGILSMGAVIQPAVNVPGVDDGAAPNDKGVIVNVDISCLVLVAVSSTKCVTNTHKPESCDPKTSGCPYGATTTVTNSRISSINPTVTSTLAFATVEPVVGAVSSVSSSISASGASTNTSSSTATATTLVSAGPSSTIAATSTTKTSSAIQLTGINSTIWPLVITGIVGCLS